MDQIHKVMEVMKLKKPNKRETVNLFFSAFLILAFIVCAQFFSQFAATLTGSDGQLNVIGQLVTVLIYVVFGLLVFYATRVGDGKAVKRFSPFTLIVLVIPALYIIIASMAKFLPLNSVFASNNGTISVIVALAGVALGYGIPYTFFSGFELKPDDEPEEQESATVLEGGIEADIMESKNAENTETAETAENAEEEAAGSEAETAAEAEDKTEAEAE
jgi:hypothetical protein